jgi:hypothetical protein
MPKGEQGLSLPYQFVRSYVLNALPEVSSFFKPHIF